MLIWSWDEATFHDFVTFQDKTKHQNKQIFVTNMNLFEIPDNKSE